MEVVRGSCRLDVGCDESPGLPQTWSNDQKRTMSIDATWTRSSRTDTIDTERAVEHSGRLCALHVDGLDSLVWTENLKRLSDVRFTASSARCSCTLGGWSCLGCYRRRSSRDCVALFAIVCSRTGCSECFGLLAFLPVPAHPNLPPRKPHLEQH